MASEYPVGTVIDRNGDAVEVGVHGHLVTLRVIGRAALPAGASPVGGTLSKTKPLMYADRAERYLPQRGIAYDPEKLSWGKLTPRQRRRSLKKEKHAMALAVGRD